jgi:hypothetical protein
VNFREFCSKVSEILNEMCPYLFVMIRICFFNFVISKVRRFFFHYCAMFFGFTIFRRKKIQKRIFFTMQKFSPHPSPAPLQKQQLRVIWISYIYHSSSSVCF